jgi:hypothetical protein
MRRVFFALAILPLLFVSSAFAGDAEIKAAQSTIDSQLKAFLADDGAAAYSYAAPNIHQLFPNVDAFMGMVTKGYAPVRKPQSYAFGKSEQMGPSRIVQQVLVHGPDGKDYEAVYTLELQPDGVWRITGCSMRATNTMST